MQLDDAVVHHRHHVVAIDFGANLEIVSVSDRNQVLTRRCRREEMGVHLESQRHLYCSHRGVVEFELDLGRLSNTLDEGSRADGVVERE